MMSESKSIMGDLESNMGEFECEFKSNVERLVPGFLRVRAATVVIIFLVGFLVLVLDFLYPENWELISFIAVLFILGLVIYLLLVNRQLRVMAQTSIQLFMHGLLFKSPNITKFVPYRDILDIQLRSGPPLQKVLMQSGLEAASHLAFGPLGLLAPAFFDSKKAGCFLYPRLGPRIRIPSFIPNLPVLVELVRERQLTR